MSTTNERGTVTLMFAILAVAFFAMIAVIYEGGRKLENLGRAQDLASEAARAAAATLDVESIAGGDIRMDLDEAENQARLIVSSSGADAELIAFDPGDTTITVAVQISGESWLPSFEVTAIGRHTAQIIDPAEFAP